MTAPRLNIDLGELDDEPETLYAVAHLASIACGGHAGDARSMAVALARCKRHGVAVGAHPSYPDREGFGRKPMKLSDRMLAATVAAQCGRLAALTEAAGMTVGHVKPHGALYHASRLQPTAHAFLDGVRAALGTGVAIVGPASGALRTLAKAEGFRFLVEGFADRAVTDDGTLVDREHPDALITDPVIAAGRAKRLARDGVDTICVHGDTPDAVAIATAVRVALDELE